MLAGCGGTARPRPARPGTSLARALIEQSFAERNLVHSGVVSVELKVTPHGSRLIRKPLTVSITGPFQAGTPGSVPALDLALTASFQGHNALLHVISVPGGGAYITLLGESYRMPASLYQGIGSVFGSIVTGTTGSTRRGGKGLLARLGIHPIGWLRDPHIVGTGRIGSTSVTDVQARLDVHTTLGDLGTLLGVASTRSRALSEVLGTTISPDEQREITRAVREPTFNLLTGTTDKIIRRLTVTAEVPVTGGTREFFGGLRRASIEISLSYADINVPQTITAPPRYKGYPQFRARVRQLLGVIEDRLFPGPTPSPAAPAS